MAAKPSDNSAQALDRTGILCSVLCVLHCLALPILASVSPTLASSLGQEWIHRGLLLFLIPITFIAFAKGYKRHGEMSTLALGCFGLLSLFVAVALESVGVEVEGLEKFLTASGSALLIIGHVKNMKALKSL